ncbi:MAG TPA: M20/M25/M40 family metallo-hydrolase [Thermoanaerobaculia bacterium]|nr:M20/M25/M40 family metallo-hydrolase [Thermoanaerobaculia bacterium]
MPIDPIALARQLIDIPSTTGDELAVGDFLFDALARLGFACRRHAVAPGRNNLYAAAGGRPRVVINSHIDTVPPWFASSEDGEYLVGRGACDTKGVIAAMIAAGERLLGDGIRDFAFLFVVGEETDSIGAKTANIEFKELGSEYVVVGEPTESKFARASKGALTATARFEGIAAHSAYPERGDSAINKLIAAVAEVNAADWGADPILGKATANVGVIRGGQKPNIIAAEAEAEMMFRLAGPFEVARAKLEALIAKHGGTLTRALGNDPQHMVVPAGAPSTIVAFNTDVPHLGNLGKPLLFGPGSILDAHGASERIAKRDLINAVGTYHDMVIALLEGRIAWEHRRLVR